MDSAVLHEAEVLAEYHILVVSLMSMRDVRTEASFSVVLRVRIFSAVVWQRVGRMREPFCINNMHIDSAAAVERAGG